MIRVVPREFLSSGMTAEEDRRLWDLPEGGADLRGPRQPCVPPPVTGPAGPYPLAGPSRVAAAPGDGSGAPLPGGAHLPPGRTGRQPLPGRQGKAARSLPGKTRTPWSCSPRRAALVLSNARSVPGPAAGPLRPGDPDRHLSGGRGRLRREDGRRWCRPTGRRTGSSMACGSRTSPWRTCSGS